MSLDLLRQAMDVIVYMISTATASLIMLGEQIEPDVRAPGVQNTRTSGNAVHGRIQDEVDRPAAGDGPAPVSGDDASQEGNINVARLMGSVEYGRPLAQCAHLCPCRRSCECLQTDLFMVSKFIFRYPQI